MEAGVSITAALVAGAASAQTLSGQVSSAQDGAMEGVLVSLKKEGSTITTTVVYKKGQKAVANFANSGGEKLSSIERAIGALGAKVKWEKLEDKTNTLSK